MKRFTILMLLAMILISGCHTVSGFGEDLNKLGDSLSRAGNKH